jgi:hypothetical protein
LNPPEGAPKILVILLGDADFGSSNVFGGFCETLAKEKDFHQPCELGGTMLLEILPFSSPLRHFAGQL